jgi:heme/copper-type cytochrome/quinol oxidase subunit 3
MKRTRTAANLHPEMAVIDVSELPTVVFGSRAPLWWGLLGMIAIESTMFALLIVAYYYLRGYATVWPPHGVDARFPIRLANLAVLLLSVWPMEKVAAAASRRDLRGMRRWLIFGTLLGLIVLYVRLALFADMSFRWNSHAYGSLVWTLLGLHTTHLVASNVENLLFVVLLFVGPVEEKHLVDLRLNSLYWYFVVISWVVLFAVIYLDPGFREVMR